MVDQPGTFPTPLVLLLVVVREGNFAGEDFEKRSGFQYRLIGNCLYILLSNNYTDETMLLQIEQSTSFENHLQSSVVNSSHDLSSQYAWASYSQECEQELP